MSLLQRLFVVVNNKFASGTAGISQQYCMPLNKEMLMFNLKDDDKEKLRSAYKKTVKITNTLAVWCAVIYLAYSYGKQAGSSGCDYDVG